MYVADCPRHGGRVLLGLDELTGIENGSSGITVRWQCPCGYRGSTRHGRRPRAL